MTKFQKLYAGWQVCCNCTHYYQHYARGKKRYYVVNGGHCTFPRSKLRRPDQTCGHWREIKTEPASES